MALPATTTLPAAPAMVGGTPDQGKEYLDALQKTLDALESRANQGPNWFQVAGALLDPGRTGNVGEAMGRAANVLGAQQQRQEEMALPIAQVRAQLVGQKYEIGNQAKAIEALSAVLGGPANAVLQQAQSALLPSDVMAKLTQAYPVIAQLSPKVGEVVKSVFGMQKDMATLATELRKAGMSQAELEAKFGPEVLSLIPGGALTRPGIPTTQPEAPIAPAAPVPSATTAPVSPIPVPAPAAPAPTATAPTQPTSPEVTQLQQRLSGLRAELSKPIDYSDPTLKAKIAEYNAISQKLKTLGVVVPPFTPATTAMAPSTAEATDLAGLPLASRAEISKKRIEEADKPYNLRRDEILSYTPQLLESSNTNLRQLDYYARNKPQIFAIMQEQGLLSGLLTAAQEGAQLTAGDFNARLGLPVKQFLEKVKLAPEDQQAVRDVSRILGSEFLANVRANKGLLGVNPTDNDARLLQAPMASIDDSAKAMQHWSRQQLLLNKQREALYGAWSTYVDKSGPTASPRNFFKPGSPYDDINKTYGEYRMQLFKQFHPER